MRFMTNTTRPLLVSSFFALSIGSASGASPASTSYAPPKADTVATELFLLGKERRSLVPTKGAKYGTGRAEIFIHAPVSAVRAAVLDYPAYPKIIPAFQKAKVLERKGASAKVYLMLPILKGAASLWSLQQFDAPSVSGKTETVVSRSLQGNIDALNTRWSFRAVDAESCVLTSDIYVEPRLPLPASAVEHEAQKAAAEAVLSVRTHTEGQWKPVKTVTSKP